MTDRDMDFHVQNIEPDLEPQLRAFMGAFAFTSFMQDLMAADDECDELSKFEHNVIIRLDRPRRLGQLAKDTNALPSTMTAIADRLEMLGYVTRERDPHDRRAWQLVLTDKGRESRSEIVNQSHSLMHELLELTKDELDAFADIATKIHTNIKKTMNDPSRLEEIRNKK